MDAYSIFPEGVWYNVSERLDPKSLVNLGGVSRVLLKEVASDQRLWSKHLKSDYNGLLRTYEDGKDYRLLYRRWREGRPFTDALTQPVHYHRSSHLVPAHLDWDNGSYTTGVSAIKLSQPGAGALVAWSMGDDGTLVRSDVTTCKTSTWYRAKGYAPSCLDVLTIDGWVLTGGKELVGWDHRQGVFPIFRQDYFDATKSSGYITALMSEESSGEPRVLTAGDKGDVCLWDLRKTDEVLTEFPRQLRGFPRQGTYDEIQCLALEPRHGTLIAGTRRGLVFWTFATGIPWATPDVQSQIALLSQDARSIAVGTERMVVGGRHGIFEWAIPPSVPFQPPFQLQGVVDLMPTYLDTGATMSHAMHAYHGSYNTARRALPQAMQGLGEGPAGILAGTADGSIGMWKCQNNHGLAQRQHAFLAHVRGWHVPEGVPTLPVPLEEVQPPLIWRLDPRPSHQVTCLAATDEVVVNGFRNGTVQFARMKQF